VASQEIFRAIEDSNNYRQQIREVLNMQRLLIATLSTIILAAAVSVNAETISTTSQTLNPSVEITPFNLVQRGYQGYFQPEIPTNAAFNSAIRSGKIKAIDLVNGAISAGRLSPEKANDRSYIRSVQTQLDNFERN
jgi:hypothetical protein